MLLFAISADLGYLIFIDINKKFIRIFVRVFTKSYATEPHFNKIPATEWKIVVQQ